MKTRFPTQIVVGVVLMIFHASFILAAPIRLAVKPKDTNQVELTFGPVIPGVLYEVLARTNGPDGHWMTFAGAFVGGSNKTITATCNLGGAVDLKGLTMETLNNWQFVAGYWEDSDGDDFPDLYEDLVARTDPYSGDDGYSDPDGDNWNNLQEMANNTDPLKWNQPPGPMSVDVGYYINGAVIIKWSHWGGTLPDYFLIERAEQSAHMNTNLVPPHFAYRTHTRTTNFSLPPPPPPRQRLPPGQIEPPFITTAGPFRPVAQVLAKTAIHEYHWAGTNDPSLGSPLRPQPVYRVSAYFTPPTRASLTQVNAQSVRQAVCPVTAGQNTNGYELTMAHPIPYFRYLLLVRDKNNPQWRACGYFASGTNRNPVYLHVDKKGMMSDSQSPIAMPTVKFLPDVVEPEFTAGWGEDSDGDGLPDIYEVLVTHTDPDNADTSNSGILDGYKELAGDGWNNLEKFRRRADPLQPVSPPAPVELKQPTWVAVMNVTQLQSDLRYEPQIQIRMAGESDYQPLKQPLEMFYRIMNPRDPSKIHGNFDVRISWQVPQMRPHESGNGP
jgi:hypothetical protein